MPDASARPAASMQTRVVVASTVMLSFISFWRAAAIVLSDLASSAYYAGAVAEQAIGKAAPWFILGIMLFSYAVKAVYQESCSMFVRGGVYRVVHEALGGTLAKFSVSALMFDYILTGPISGVSAGLYLGGLINEAAEHVLGRPHPLNQNAFAVVVAIAVILYFWRKNTIGLHESSESALRIMQVTTAMVVVLIAWCLYTVLARGYQPVPMPWIGNLELSTKSLGWLPASVAISFPAIAVMVGLGHSLLAMSGFETLAQVNREIAHPKQKNLQKAGLVIFVYSLVFTSLVSFFAVMLIPDAERSAFLDNLIGGIAMHLAGPVWARLLFHAFVVVVGALILAGAVNTAIIGSNGVLNRIAEDGVLPVWMRRPHPRYGTTYRMIDAVVVLQVGTVLLSRGDIMVLGEAYAFGVVWSFAMKSLSVLVLRFKMPEAREWRVPLNLRLQGREVPIGLALITAFLFALAVVNLVTKPIATVAGALFTAILFTVFQVTERRNRKRAPANASHEQFRLDTADEISAGSVDVRPGNVLVAVRNPHRLTHVKRVLERTDTSKMQIVVVSVRRITGEHTWTTAELFGERESDVFTNVVALAEKEGKNVKLLVVPGADPVQALIKTAARLGSVRIVVGASPRLSVAEQGLEAGRAWERLEPPRPSMSLEVVAEDGSGSKYFNLGPHPPRLWPEDVERVHKLWLELSEAVPRHDLHHRDVVGLALERLEADLHGRNREEVIAAVNRGSAKA